ncbi:MAG TPA: ROK family protein, partial [Vicinamibacterales bacterium]|nr:ROK family protein [Vicinamibacterales bacterium]
MRIGIDLGGTKIEAIALDDDGRERLRQRIAAPRGEYAATLKAIVDLVRHVEQTLGERGTVGIGIPGTIARVSGLVKNANSTWLNGQRIGDDLPALLDRPVRFE